MPHGSIFEFLWDFASDEFIKYGEKGLSRLIDKAITETAFPESDMWIDVIASENTQYFPFVKNATKIIKFFTEDTTDAASRAVISIEGGYFSSAHNAVRPRSISAISVFVDADEENYTISTDGSTLTLNGSADIYVTGEVVGTATMTVTCYTWDEESQSFSDDVYTLNCGVTDDVAEAVAIGLGEPDDSTVSVPYTGTTVVKFPYAACGAKWPYCYHSSFP